MISCHSFSLMLLSSAIVFGYAYCLDLFQALEVHFRQEPYNFTTMEFNLMYFFTYLPIFLFNIPIGMIIDRSSVKKSLFVLLFMNLFSQIVCTIMVSTRAGGYIIVMYFMRSLFGVAGEGMFTVQGLIITKYCKDNFEIVMSIALGLPFVFDSLNSLVTTRVYDYTDTMVWPWSIGIIVSVISVISGFILYFLFIRKRIKRSEQLSLLEAQASLDNQQIKIANQQQQSQFNIKQLRMMPKMFWILMVSSFFAEVSLGGFMDNLNDLLVKRFNIPYTDAGALLIIPYSGLTIFSIIFSVLISKKPSLRRISYLISTFLYALGQVFVYLLPQTQNPSALYYVTVGFFTSTISLNFSIYYTAILAVLPQIVPGEAVGTAYGVVGSVVGLSQCLGPFMNIAIIDSDSDLSISYKSLNLAYIFISTASACLALYIKIGPYSSLDSNIQDKPQQPQGQSRIASEQS